MQHLHTLTSERLTTSYDISCMFAVISYFIASLAKYVVSLIFTDPQDFRELEKICHWIDIIVISLVMVNSFVIWYSRDEPSKNQILITELRKTSEEMIDLINTNILPDGYNIRDSSKWKDILNHRQFSLLTRVIVSTNKSRGNRLRADQEKVKELEGLEKNILLQERQTIETDTRIQKGMIIIVETVVAYFARQKLNSVPGLGQYY